ncbi:MAG TPA: DNA ligase D [Ideonella sp.]|uniref:DNA ligase D n=1 Tax=Ideonella sp. TaxID=1929293 RepID=UPI002D0E4326|nr:DNA ligase D [Ideonella sp.]HSI51848.1 DNA ligase D [Ideonella sp.]
MSTAATGKLAAYKAKRNFSITGEPAEGGVEGVDALSFVVQKHWATRLHYDFRIELDGVMLSWAVPKGPSYDSHDKRLAAHVEDHPISYSSFEGTIPAGQYGAGKVIVWDEGTWHPVGDSHAALRAGNLKFELRGHKLKGKWALIRMKGRGEKQEPWLLIKEKDEYVRPASEFSVVDEFPDSVKSLQEPPPKKTAVRKAPAKRAAKRGAGAAPLHPGAKPAAALPKTFSPQLATLVDAPPGDPSDWVYEIKFDGYRLLARIDAGDVQLHTRNGNDWTAKLKPLQAEIARMKLPDGWYDGEIVVLNDKGVPDFGALQTAFDAARPKPIVYFVFDVPFMGGFDLREVPLDDRRAALRTALATRPSEHVKFSEAFDAPPGSVVASACRLGLEGVIAKRRDAAYRSTRSSDWIKLKCSHRQEFVIGGWTDPKASRTGIGSLLLGVYEGGKLRYAGNVGTGFDTRTLSSTRAKLDGVASDANPFAKGDAIPGKPHWVRPELVAEVTFGEWTSAGHIRHSVFHALRLDKDAKAIVREKAKSAPRGAKAQSPAKAAPLAAKATQETREAPVSHALNTKLRITHPERVIDASTGITKVELIRYYGLVGRLMMDHLRKRPVSLVRAPAGVAGQVFFQKHAEVEKLPGVVQLDASLDADHPPMLEVATADGLLAAAQWNVVEFHTQNALAGDYEHPDRIVFDLDPGEGVDWSMIKQAAELMRAFLGDLGLGPFLKTSGGKGLHVVVPLKPKADWDRAKAFSKAVVDHVARTIPQMFVSKSGGRNRVGKIFIDYLRNGRGSTTACAWSARSRPGMGISVPVAWEELAKLRGGDHWTIRSVQARLDVGNDAWKGYAKAARTLDAAAKALGFKL